MFHPDEVIFAPTGACNLNCAHCRVRRDAGELSPDDAVAFLDACQGYGVERVGFSGGEPFLRQDFVTTVCKAAVGYGMYFDRLMTNGDWWSTEAELVAGLRAVCDAGFDGIIGLSWDSWHAQDTSRIVTFLQTVFSVWRRRDVVEILAVRSADDAAFLSALESVAVALGGRLEHSFGEPVRMADTREFGEDQPDDGSELSVPVIVSQLSLAGAGNARPGVSAPDSGGTHGVPGSALVPAAAGWNDGRWFLDDHCEGPGNVFYVHPDGSVAPCCGFANERAELKIGTIHDPCDVLLAAAGTNPHVVAAFDEGLGAVRERLAKGGVRFPGITRDICLFCDHLCHTGALGVQK